MTDMPNVTPKTEVEREIYFGKINEWIKLENIRKSATKSQSDIIASLKETYAEDFDKSEQSDAKKFAEKVIKHQIGEFLKGSITEEQRFLDAAQAEYEVSKKYLKD